MGKPDVSSDLKAIIDYFKPDVLVGAVGRGPNCFTKEVVQAMAAVQVACPAPNPSPSHALTPTPTPNPTPTPTPTLTPTPNPDPPTCRPTRSCCTRRATC